MQSIIKPRGYPNFRAAVEITYLQLYLYTPMKTAWDIEVFRGLVFSFGTRAEAAEWGKGRRWFSFDSFVDNYTYWWLRLLSKLLPSTVWIFKPFIYSPSLHQAYMISAGGFPGRHRRCWLAGSSIRGPTSGFLAIASKYNWFSLESSRSLRPRKSSQLGIYYTLPIGQVCVPNSMLCSCMSLSSVRKRPRRLYLHH